MKLPLFFFLIFTPATAPTANPMDLVEAGFSLTQKDADRLEQDLRKKPHHEAARLKLLGYYAGSPESIATDVIRARRAEHIFWLIKNNPQSGLFEYATAVWKIHLKGDALADPQAFEQAKALWMRQVEANPRDDKMKINAAAFLRIGDPETAASLLKQANLTRAVGSLYVQVLLGVVSEDYKTGDAAAVDESFRTSDYAQRVLRELRSSEDPSLVGGAGFWLAVQGGILYADRKLSWDYTELAGELLAKARLLDPNTLDWYAVSTKLPSYGERPPRVFRVAGNAMKSSLRKSTTPEYPELARAKGIEGTVRVNILIGLDGKIIKALVESGPSELQQASLDAISEWEFAPKLLGGKPVFVITKIAIEYRLRDGVLILLAMDLPSHKTPSRYST